MASLRNYNKFHALLSKCGLMEEKKALVSHFSNGRTESSRELTDREFRELEVYLTHRAMQVAEKDTRDIQRKKFIAIMRERGFEKGDKADMKRIYDWVTNSPKSCMKGKSLNELTSSELNTLIYQAKQIKDFYEEKQKISDIVS